MNRRRFTRNLAGTAALGAMGAAAQNPRGHPRKIEPDWESIHTHQVPDWYRNAKLGIFIHWGLYSVPAWAPPTGELGKVDPTKWFTNNPYAEWYLNTLRIPGSPTRQHHFKTYGRDFDYYQFTPTFNKETAKWDPSIWAALFRKTGARYAVLTTKHHDGFRLWPSKVANPKRPGPNLSAARDLAGDLTAAVRAQGLKMGLYYSGGLDWTFTSEPIQTMAGLRRMVPQSEEYARYADAHWTELTDRYQPSVMWNDINYPKLGNLPGIFAHYYGAVPDGVINNRFGVGFSDFTTPEYARYDKITEKKWESCRGLGFSFGYNQAEGPEHVIAPDKLIALLVDIVSKNGNLLLNIGPRPDGSISDIQLDRLHKLGDWLAVNGEGIFDTQPWVRASASDKGAPDVRFTRKGDSVYAFLLERPSSNAFTIPGVIAAERSTVRILGASADSEWAQHGRDLEVTVRGTLPGNAAVGVRITPEPWQVVKS
ncbi:MAG: alpha-L-fucosidase [Bryobacterales bacterium]|nr:alpha-L-fucosidase [Bryobacterales bacterium]